jgi:hypothetical protein
MLFGDYIINIEISTNRLTPYLSEDRDSSYYQPRWGLEDDLGGLRQRGLTRGGLSTTACAGRAEPSVAGLRGGGGRRWQGRQAPRHGDEAHGGEGVLRGRLEWPVHVAVSEEGDSRGGIKSCRLTTLAVGDALLIEVGGGTQDSSSGCPRRSGAGDGSTSVQGAGEQRRGASSAMRTWL